MKIKKKFGRKPYQMIDHTADIGFIVEGESLPALFEIAAWSMVDLMSDPDQIKAKAKQEVEVEGEGYPDILVKWLNALLVLFEGDGFIGGKFKVENLTEKSLKASVWGEPFDREKHPLGYDIKAATYHELEVTETKGRWKTQIIFDV